MSVTFTGQAWAGDSAVGTARITWQAQVRINLTHAHACTMLTLLGYNPDEDYAGQCDPELFLGRVLLAVALIDSVAAGTRDLKAALGQLRSVADDTCRHYGAKVVWA